MTNTIGNRENSAKAQFDEAVRRLEAAEARVQALFANPHVDESTRQMALEVYEEARLLWLSSEAILRSMAVNCGPSRHEGQSVVILGGDTPVGESIAILLRLRGFRTAVLSRNRADEQISRGPAAAVIVDIERDPDNACVLAVSTLDTYPGSRIIGMVPPVLENYDWRGFDAILVKPASIDTIVQAIAGDPGP
ncbi:conserved protein of unknown function [Burkholderia multivorans]